MSFLLLSCLLISLQHVNLAAAGRGPYQNVECPSGRASSCNAKCFYRKNRTSITKEVRRWFSDVGLSCFMDFEAQELTWKHKKSNDSSNVFLTAFHVQGQYGAPTPTCCHVPLGKKKCRVAHESDVFCGLEINGTMLVFWHQSASFVKGPDESEAANQISYHEDETNNETLGGPAYVPDFDPDDSASCYALDNSTKLCLYIDAATGLMEVDAQEYGLHDTNSVDFYRARAQGSFREMCVYQLGEVLVKREGQGLEGRPSLSDMFQRPVYNLSDYWRREGFESECVRHNLSLDNRLHYGTEPGHMLCFSDGPDKMHYCMSGNGTGYVPPKKDLHHGDGATVATTTIILAALGGVILLVLASLPFLALSSGVRKFLRKRETLPTGLDDILEKHHDVEFSPCPDVKEQAIPLTLEDYRPADSPKSLRDSNGKIDTLLQFVTDRSSLREGSYITGEQRDPVEGVYTDHFGSGLSGDDTSGHDTTVFSGDGSAGSVQMARACFSETSIDTGRGSYGSASDSAPEAAEPRSVVNTYAGAEALDPRRPVNVVPIPDDVFLPAVPDFTCAGLKPGTELEIFQTLFAKRSSGDSALGRDSQSGDALPDYSVVGH